MTVCVERITFTPTTPGGASFDAPVPDERGVSTAHIVRIDNDPVTKLTIELRFLGEFDFEHTLEEVRWALSAQLLEA